MTTGVVMGMPGLTSVLFREVLQIEPQRFSRHFPFPTRSPSQTISFLCWALIDKLPHLKATSPIACSIAFRAIRKADTTRLLVQAS